MWLLARFALLAALVLIVLTQNPQPWPMQNPYAHSYDALRLDSPDFIIMGLAVFVLVFVFMTGLRWLQLSGNGVTDAGLEHLTGLYSLSELYVYHTAVTQSGVASLKAALPGCTIFVDEPIPGRSDAR